MAKAKDGRHTVRLPEKYLDLAETLHLQKPIEYESATDVVKKFVVAGLKKEGLL